MVVEEQLKSMKLLRPHISVLPKAHGSSWSRGGGVDFWTVDYLEHNLNVVQMEY